MNQFNQLDAQDEMTSLAFVSTLEIFSSEENEVEKKACEGNKLD